jgi:hypothetical protein
MKKAIVIFVTVLLALFFCCELKASTVQKSIIPAEADWMIHFDLEKFSATQIGEYLLSEEGTVKLRKKSDQFKKRYQINILEDIDGITVFGFGKSEKKTVVCLKGNFDRDYLLGLLAVEESHREIPYGKYTIHNWDSHEYGAFADEHLALLGSDEGVIKLALDVIAGKKANITSSPMNSYLNEIPSHAFFAAMAKDISALAEEASKVFIIKKTESALFTLAEKKENINILLNFTVKTLEDAKNMESVVRGLISLANMQLGESHKEIRIPEDIKIETKGQKVLIEISYPTKSLLDFALGKANFSSFYLLGALKRLP